MDKSIEAALMAAFESWGDSNSMADSIHAAIAAYRDAEIERLTAENERLLDVLEQHGFRHCSIAACNCNSWHHVGGFAARFREIEEATNDYWQNGEPLLARIERIVAKLEASERDAERYREWKRAFREGECGLWNALCEANSESEHDAAIDAVRGGER